MLLPFILFFHSLFDFLNHLCARMRLHTHTHTHSYHIAAGKVFVHGINMLPFTPASELYLTHDWVSEEYPVVMASTSSSTPEPWLGFLIGTHCVIDAEAGWKEIQKLSVFDGGMTRSNLMYWCATRPQQRLESNHSSIPRVILAEA